MRSPCNCEVARPLWSMRGVAQAAILRRLGSDFGVGVGAGAGVGAGGAVRYGTTDTVEEGGTQGGRGGVTITASTGRGTCGRRALSSRRECRNNGRAK